MSSEFAIKVEGVGKNYQIYDKPHHRLWQMLRGVRKTYYRDFWAVKNVSFSVRRGDTVGIIGRNGAGKSTLLQMICGTLTPTTGSIEVNGRVAALLELGAGFNPEFTGRENVYMNSAVLGLSREETDARFADIIAFADIGDFIGQPVKTYSSGMMVRLAFAVIAHVDADILVVDEALAVGDAFFTQKCMRFIQQFQKNGGTLLFVSHDMGTVMNICQSAIMLFAGGQRNAIMGAAEALCKEYLNQIYDDPERHQQVEQQRSLHEPWVQRDSTKVQTVLTGIAPEKNVYAISPFRADGESFGAGGATITDAGFFAEDGERFTMLEGGQTVRFRVCMRANQALTYPALGIMLKDRLGQYLYTAGTDESFRHHRLVFQAGENICATFQFDMPILSRGVYTINVAVAEGTGDAHIQHHWIHDAIKLEVVSGPVVHGLGSPLNMEITMEFLQPVSEVTA
ncbi:ABC transporter ATP-binding protein [Thiothrix nivea]|uniref:ABC transporter related protein n=1 Tax=Thiothrix nivea (strain ATCC 35100 / DSM 5205 / JP2) TaxID=870187 RepID=A0A656HG20_THINJ|nr:ABC transporter ATP-binding protein [Thiothrix nivea]EIJ35971.1 ABC transporter related protein [Thiothrix nivea DSM 5205]